MPRIFDNIQQSLLPALVETLQLSDRADAGLSSQGELNVDVVDQDAAKKLARWFEDRREDRWCIDISEELVQIIDESWAREVPYYQLRHQVPHRPER